MLIGGAVAMFLREANLFSVSSIESYNVTMPLAGKRHNLDEMILETHSSLSMTCLTSNHVWQ